MDPIVAHRDQRQRRLSTAEREPHQHVGRCPGIDLAVQSRDDSGERAIGSVVQAPASSWIPHRR
jgi:hypothetical protein